MQKKTNIVNTVQSRYGDERIIRNQGGGCYTLEASEVHYIRQSKDDNGNITMFDFDGGPCLFVGERFLLDPSNGDAVIESIMLDECTPVKKKYTSIVDESTKTAEVYNVRVSVTVG